MRRSGQKTKGDAQPLLGTKLLRVGTRGSPLALAQARQVAAELQLVHGLPDSAIEIVVIKTVADSVLDRPLSEIGGKGLFTKEIEEALLDGRIDLAVHSMKDVATALPDGLVIDCLLPREDPRDAFLSPVARSLKDLPKGARVGTSSLRRQAQVKALRPDLEVVPFRGNIDTRAEKLAAGAAEATFLALAGLNRMGRSGDATAVLAPEEMMPAVAQGAIGIERRAGDEALAAALRPLNHAATGYCVSAERAFLKVLDGSCRTPIAALAMLDGDSLWLRGLILTPDGAQIVKTERTGAVTDAVALGTEAGREVRSRAGPEFFTGGV